MKAHDSRADPERTLLNKGAQIERNCFTVGQSHAVSAYFGRFEKGAHAVLRHFLPSNVDLPLVPERQEGQVCFAGEHAEDVLADIACQLEIA
jgi:hypothetical protein